MSQKHLGISISLARLCAAVALAAGLSTVAACSSGSTGTGGGGTGTAGGESSCEGLDEAACDTTAGCTSVRGVPFERGSTTTADLQGSSTEFAGCTAVNSGGEYQTCVYDPAVPDTCYWVQNQRIPDGWAEDFECNDCALP